MPSNNQVFSVRPHGDGVARVAFSKDGSKVFTGGQDCLVRIWDIEGGIDKEPSTAAEAEEPITWIAATEDCWLSASEDGEVRRYEKDSTSFDSPIASAVGVAARCVAIDPQARKVAVATDELFVRVVDMENVMNQQKLEGYASPVRAASWDPSGNLLATCTQDGKIIIWDMAQSPPKKEKVLDGIIPIAKDESTPDFSYDCSVVWHTSGQHFYVASKAHEIVTISRSDWSRVPGGYTDKNMVGAITALAISPNGAYLLSACKSTVYVWSTQTKRSVAQHTGNQGSVITQLTFNPRRNLVAWADKEGGFTRWVQPVPTDFPDPIKASIGTKAGASTTITRKPDTDLFGEDDLGASAALDGDIDLGTMDEDEDMIDPDKDWIIDDMDGAINDEPAREATRSNGYVKEMVSITKAQPPFQPGSTPFQNKKRYLAYNILGVIEAIDQDIHQVINVVFFNQSSRTSFHFNDPFKNDMGYLGDCGAVFACPPEENHPARVLFKPYSPTAQEWTYTLRPSTRVHGIAAGGLAPSTFQGNNSVDLQGFGNVVVATSEHDLTFLTGTGRERRIMALPGDFVTMVAAPEWVLVVYRPGSTTIDGSQNLYFVVINFEDFSVRQRDVLPIPKGHTLKWLGLTEEGLPAIYDSNGYLSVLTKVRLPHHAAWVRIMDTNLLERRQGKDETYWPVGINDDSLMCLILKGNQEYPGFPRPLIQELEIRLPFRQADAREEQIERNLLYVQTAFDSLDDDLTTDTIQSREQAIDKEFILLIQAACKAGNLARAIELVKLLHNLPSFDAAIAIANFYNLRGLTAKFEFVKQKKEEDEDRLVVARNKRRRWLKPDPMMRQVASNGNGSGMFGGAAKYDPLGDTRPPPQVERPGMSRVVAPVIEKTQYERPRFGGSTQIRPTPAPASVPWDEDQTLQVDSPTQAEKRKRDVLEEFPMVEDSMPPPKNKGNPFARKAGQETNRNPFARSAEKQGSLHKSESFFEKVDIAEGGGSISSKKRNAFKGKEKVSETAKGGARQGTLSFGVLPKKSKSKPTADDSEVDTQIETQIETQEDTQNTVDDVSMGDSPLEETQPLDEESLEV